MNRNWDELPRRSRYWKVETPRGWVWSCEFNLAYELATGQSLDAAPEDGHDEEFRIHIVDAGDVFATDDGCNARSVDTGTQHDGGDGDAE
jgi:hypothetical protein